MGLTKTQIRMLRGEPMFRKRVFFVLVDNEQEDGVSTLRARVGKGHKIYRLIGITREGRQRLMNMDGKTNAEHRASGIKLGKSLFEKTRASSFRRYGLVAEKDMEVLQKMI